MLIQCPKCQRSHDVDEAKSAGIVQAICVCGAPLELPAITRGVARVGRYTLVNQIAIGGMGEIWFALQGGSDGFEKEVVVKRLLPNFAADRDVTAMLIKEAKVSSRLKHPNIVEVYDLVRLEGNYLIVMEYVPGITVRDLVNACCKIDVTPPWQLAVYITLQLLRGLGYAHRLPQRDGSFSTFIHRDISPQNLLICRDATLKITDFGIAKAINEASNTAPGLIRGKASYLTPERVRGGDVNEMSDLFPAAIVLFEMLTLTSLFRADTHEGTLRKLFETQVPDLANYRNDVSPAVEMVMRRALHRQVFERFANAREFELALLDACAPITTEQIQAVASGFLQEHPDFFDSVTAHKDGPSDAASAKAAAAPDRPPHIETLVHPAAASSRRPRGSVASPPVASEAPQVRPLRPRWWSWAAGGLLVTTLGIWLFWRGVALVPTTTAPDPIATLHDTSPTAAAASDVPSAGSQGASPAPKSVVGPALRGIVQPPDADSEADPTPEAPVPGSPSPSPQNKLFPASEAPEASETPVLTVEVPAVTAGGTDKAPRHRELHVFFRRHAAKLMTCFTDNETDVDIEIAFEIAPSGHVSADVSALDVDESTLACLTKQIARLRFRPFVGAPTNYTLPIHIDSAQP